MNKQMVRRCRDVRWELDGKTVKYILEYLPKLGLPESANIYFGVFDDYGTYVPEVTFDWFEEETDEEYQQRLDMEAKRLEYERMMYEKLKKKFEGGSK